jgi:hypothetical protein
MTGPAAAFSSYTPFSSSFRRPRAPPRRVGVGVGDVTTTTTSTAARLYVDGGSESSSSSSSPPFATPSSSSSTTTTTSMRPPRGDQRHGERRCEYDIDVDDECDGGIIVDEDGMVVERDPFEVWGKMRLGLGSGRGSTSTGMVYWVGSGSLHEAYTGKLIAIFEGYDVGRGMRLSEDRMRQLSRKIFWFRDPITGEVMTEYNGMPVRPIVYDAQVIDYHRDRGNATDEGEGGGYGSITYSVEASLRKLKGAIPSMRITSRDVGRNQMMINVPVFLDVPVPSSSSSGTGNGDDGGVGGSGDGQRRYRAWEFYDYNVDPSFPPDRPPTAVWCRQGSVPPFFDVNNTNAVLRFSGHRVDKYEELPRRMRDEVEKYHPHFVGPPLDLEEAMRQAEGPNR